MKRLKEKNNDNAMMYGLDRLLFFERIDHSNLFKHNDHHLYSNDVYANLV